MPAPDAEPEDAVLMQRVAHDDPAAMGLLVERHQRTVLNFFVRSGAQSHAEDLAQETFIRLYRYRHRYRPVARLTTFLHTLARHVWIDFLRRRGRSGRLIEEWSHLQPVADEHSSGRAARRLDAERAVRELPEEMRDVVILVFFQGLNYQETADVLGIPLGTVKSRMFHALHRLRESMDHDTGESP